ncbi:hypothetical protein [Algicola sagamiensis]|uniref:hypothetical protein n=1 Tax=Algicola sagamiensis TaxID=163869 RepID=UPI00036AA8ED|nr:hypothetical protein [Algicola sagamiensis]
MRISKQTYNRLVKFAHRLGQLTSGDHIHYQDLHERTPMAMANQNVKMLQILFEYGAVPQTP